MFAKHSSALILTVFILSILIQFCLDWHFKIILVLIFQCNNVAEEELPRNGLIKECIAKEVFQYRDPSGYFASNTLIINFQLMFDCASFG